MGNRSYTTTNETTSLEFLLMQNQQAFDASSITNVVIYPSYSDAVNGTNAIETITSITHVSTGLYSYTAALIATAGTYYDKITLVPVAGGLSQNFINSFIITQYTGSGTGAVTFKVEDGTAYTDSTSYASVVQYQTYCGKFGYDYSTDTTDNIEVYLNQATSYLDKWYKFLGFKRLVWTQALEWPRILSHTLGRPYEFMAFRYLQSNEIPKELIEATCYLAYTFKTEGQLHYIDKGETAMTIGPVSVTYNRRKNYVRYPEVDALLEYLTTSGGISKRVR